MSFLVMFFLPCFFQGSWEPLPKAPLHEMDVHLAANPSENLILRFGTGKLYYSSPAQSIWNGRDWVRSIPGVNLPSTEEPLLTYDPVNKGILLFGGARLGKNNYSFSNTTRLWKNGKWTTLRPKTSPSPRYVSSFTTDTKRNKIVFWAGGDSDFVRGRHYANQTWEWDGKDWKGILNPIFPTIRWRGTMGFDPVSGKCLLFGGTTGPFGVSVYLNDLWSWDGKVWREIKKTKGKPWPSVRGWTQRFVFHPKLQRLLLIGGMEKDSKSGWVFHSDTWAWDG
ncbi:MAG TPA: hypothetical protein ENK02_07790, partial [Planctomycetes bacterium]|nr:hypothetical protein [Planctomycetota bacterium]